MTQSVGVGVEEGCKSRIVLYKRLLSHLRVTAISSDEDIVIFQYFLTISEAHIALFTTLIFTYQQIKMFSNPAPFIATNMNSI